MKQEFTPELFADALRRAGNHDTLRTIFILGWLSNRVNARAEGVLLSAMAHMSDSYSWEVGRRGDPGNSDEL